MKEAGESQVDFEPKSEYCEASVVRDGLRTTPFRGKTKCARTPCVDS